MITTMIANKSGMFPSCQALFHVLFRNCITPTLQRKNSGQGGEVFAQLWESGCEIRRTSSRACHRLNSADPRGAEKEVSGTQCVVQRAVGEAPAGQGRLVHGDLLASLESGP